MKNLDDRKRRILKTAVYDFVLRAEPVSSKKLQKQYGIDFSTATIRNELAVLEDMGYLYQPHTSAGRIPTDLGYRFYVDNLQDSDLNFNEDREVSDIIHSMSLVIEDSLRQTSVLLSQLTHYVSIVFAPPASAVSLKRLDLVPLGPGEVLLVMILSTGSVEKCLIKARQMPDAGSVAHLETELNVLLSGRSLKDLGSVRNSLEQFGFETRSLAGEIISRIIAFFESESSEKVFFEGAQNILEEPEFENLRRLRGALEALEHRYQLIQVLSEAIDNTSEIMVKIGSENRSGLIEDCSLIAGRVKIADDTLGILGIIGPTRMDYARNISTVHYIARELGKLFNGE